MLSPSVHRGMNKALITIAWLSLKVCGHGKLPSLVCWHVHSIVIYCWHLNSIVLYRNTTWLRNWVRLPPWLCLPPRIVPSEHSWAPLAPPLWYCATISWLILLLLVSWGQTCNVIPAAFAFENPIPPFQSAAVEKYKHNLYSLFYECLN